MKLKRTLEEIRLAHRLVFLLAISDEGMVMAEAGELPTEGFAPYTPMAMETMRVMAQSGELGPPLCNATILSGGRMLVLYQTEVISRTVYLCLMCNKVPRGLKNLLEQVAEEVGRALGGRIS